MSERAEHPLLTRNRPILEELVEEHRTRRFFTRYPESPSRQFYGEDAAAQGRAAFEAHLGQRYAGLADQPTTAEWVGGEVSAFGVELGMTYPELDVDAAITAASAALPAWRDAGPQVRAAVAIEAVERLAARSFEIGHVTMHHCGQSFVMAFQAGGPHAQDRGSEAIAAALVEQQRVPTQVTWTKPQKAGPIVMDKTYTCVPRGIALLVGCNTFPTWNSYSAIYASLVTGNPVLVKPHPNAILALAITVEVTRDVLREAGFDPALIQLAPENPGGTLARTLAERPEVKIIDYTGGPAFGEWLEELGGRTGKRVFTEKAGINSVVIDSTDDAAGMLANLAHSLCLYSGQMCTSPQNIYVPRDGIHTDQGHLSFDDLCRELASAVTELVDGEKAHDVLGATVNDVVRANVAALEDIAAESEGRVVLTSRRLQRPDFPDAQVQTPGLVAMDVSREDCYTQERFGPVAFLIETASTAQSIAQLRDTICQHGAITAAVYTTDDAVLDAAREAAMDAAVALSENLTDRIFVNQAAAFSDYHGSGGNPAANASYLDAAFVASRFVIAQSRRHH